MNEMQDRSQIYQIKIQGQLDRRWAEWFAGASVAYHVEEDGTIVTTLTGPVVDQAALHGLLMKIRDLNLRLVSVVGLTADQEGSSNE